MSKQSRLFSLHSGFRTNWVCSNEPLGTAFSVCFAWLEDSERRGQTELSSFLAGRRVVVFFVQIRENQELQKLEMIQWFNCRLTMKHFVQNMEGFTSAGVLNTNLQDFLLETCCSCRSSPVWNHRLRADLKLHSFVRRRAALETVWLDVKRGLNSVIRAVNETIDDVWSDWLIYF